MTDNNKFMHPPVREQGVCDVKVYAINSLTGVASFLLIL